MQIEIRGAEELSPRERQVVVLKESGQTNPAIARRLGIGEATVATSKGAPGSRHGAARDVVWVPDVG